MNMKFNQLLQFDYLYIIYICEKEPSSILSENQTFFFPQRHIYLYQWNPSSYTDQPYQPPYHMTSKDHIQESDRGRKLQKKMTPTKISNTT